MNHEMNLRLDESDVPEFGHGAFDPPPTPVWAETDFGSWRIGLRLQHRDGHPVLSEVRVFPAETDAPPGQWSGDVTNVDAGGFRPDFFRKVAIGALRDQAIQCLTDPEDSFWVNGWPIPQENWFDIANYAGIEANADADVPGRPGRQPISDEELAIVARYYTEAQRNRAKSTHEYIRNQVEIHRGAFLSEGTIGGRIYKARKRGFLTPAEKKGKKGGSLTPKARDLLRKIDSEGKELR
jgi:hypothetical protein